MNIGELQRVYFIGIGGIGMSALARHFHAGGAHVAGYDRTATYLTRRLEGEGIAITYNDSIEELDREAGLVVYTPAIPADHRQLNFYRDHGYDVRKRAAVLGTITGRMKGLAVAGSHGKTSTCSILNHILQTAGYDCAAFLGGISLNYDSNYVSGGEWAVAEADEFDRSFHQLHPSGAIITSVDTDHLDVYGDYESIVEGFGQFASQVQDVLVFNKGIPAKVAARTAEGSVSFSYGLEESADYHASRIEVRNGRYSYDVRTPFGAINDLELQGGGRHNIENSIGAMALAGHIGIGSEHIREAISTYRGVQRRFEIHIDRAEMVYIDDYAHHPREIEVTLATARELYPDRKMTVIFQPHLFTRTRDLADGLADSLSAADEVLLLDIYPAREKPIEGVDSGVIYRLLKTSKYLVAKNQVITQLNELQPELVLTIGAGDIDTLVQPIVKNFQNA